ncbi:hypothetical protein [Staphylococcus nepalensis]|uniref:hypothetical protein n=1 Tax=Staphylococcus nepalensis TaxID=214473 RepID=UPI000BC343B2|nr:hypothetical protein [Staphylococcus nepalensis]ATH60212.1 hypothetical protein BJD96_07795 [Staphylococcus nepalensis]
MNTYTIPSPEDIRKALKTFQNMDLKKVIDTQKEALKIDKNSLVKSIKLAPKVSEIISKTDIKEISNKFFQQFNVSSDVQQSLVNNVLNTKIRFDSSSDNYKIQPPNINNNKIIKDYTPLIDFLHSVNKSFSEVNIQHFYSLTLIGAIPFQFIFFICILHFLISWVLVEIKNKQKNVLEQKE